MSGVDAHALCGGIIYASSRLSKRSKRSVGVRDERAAQQRQSAQVRGSGRGETELPASIYQSILTKYMAILTEGLAFHERQDPLA